eukprot:scaffold188051_cov31-Tisochrysis_lutea.AAC.2
MARTKEQPVKQSVERKSSTLNATGSKSSLTRHPGCAILPPFGVTADGSASPAASAATGSSK